MNGETKQFDLSQKVYKLVIAIIILVGISYLGNLFYNFQSLPQNYPQEISVSGQGKVYAKPDVAVVVLEVRNEGLKIQDIVKENTDKMNKIIKDIKDLGIDEKDIQTTRYSITPQYNWTQKQGRIFIGYLIEQQITIKIRDFDKVGSVLDKATTDGANTVGDLQFTIDEPEKVRAEARAKAIEQAKEKAKTLANQAGLRIVKLINISEGSGVYPQSIYAKDVGGGESVNAIPEIQPGQMEITSNITLTYRIR